jgi:hypothetical protein
MTDHETKNTITAAAELPTARSILYEQSRKLGPIDDDATRDASSKNKEPDSLGGGKMALLQEAIDEVNSRSFGSHHSVRHQQVPHEEMVASDEAEIENESTSSVHLDAIQQTSGNKRKRHAPIKSFDERFNDLMSFKAKYGHCDVSKRGEDASLGQWCSQLRGSYKRIQKNQKPRAKLSDGQIQRLTDAGFKWSLLKANSTNLGFDEHFNDLMAFKAKYGHCNVPQQGADASLGQWCSQLRVSYKKIQNNQKPPRMKLSDEQIQRLNDAGFKWSLGKFDKHLNDLMAFKAKYGHCHVPQNGENASLGRWCRSLRYSYKKMQNNQKTDTKLSDGQIQRLNDVGFTWRSLRGAPRTSIQIFDERLNDLMAFEAKDGHCDVPCTGENASLGKWCSELNPNMLSLNIHLRKLTYLPRTES